MVITDFQLENETDVSNSNTKNKKDTQKDKAKRQLERSSPLYMAIFQTSDVHVHVHVKSFILVKSVDGE